MSHSPLSSAIASVFGSDKLPSWFPLHHYNEPAYNYSTEARLLDFSKGSLWVAVGCVLFNPVFWNVVARNEYRNKTMTKVLGSPYTGCYVLAVTIFSLGIFRDFMYERALREQPHLAVLAHPAWQAVAYILIGIGQVFVITSIYALGITGTYLGDYFGILMSHRVTGFPFNVLTDPMYVGSTLAFVGSAILYQCPAGLGISALVWVVYVIALRFEGPFTDKIYSAASKKTDSAPTVPAPSTPRKSTRLANKTSSEQLKTTAESSATSYAEAAAEPPAANGLPSTAPARTPRPRKSVAARVKNEDGAGSGSGSSSPARMTRSRSKGRVGSVDESD